MMTTLFYLILAVILIGLAIYIYTYLAKQQDKFIPKNKYDEEWNEFHNKQLKTGLSKTSLSISLVIASLCSVFARFLGVGWVLLFLGVITVGFPLGIHIILHVSVILRAQRGRPALFIAAIFSNIFLFLFLSTQWDAFDGPAHSGLIEILSFVGMNISPFYTDISYKLSYIFAILLLLSWILMFLPMFYHKHEKSLEKY